MDYEEFLRDSRRQGEAPDPESNSGANCAPSVEPSTLSKKLDTLNCLVFRTPHTFWVNVSDDFGTRLKNGDWIGMIGGLR